MWYTSSAINVNLNIAVTDNKSSMTSLAVPHTPSYPKMHMHVIHKSHQRGRSA